jgi:hypothetical protein
VINLPNVSFAGFAGFTTMLLVLPTSLRSFPNGESVTSVVNLLTECLIVCARIANSEGNRHLEHSVSSPKFNFMSNANKNLLFLS